MQNYYYKTIKNVNVINLKATEIITPKSVLEVGEKIKLDVKITSSNQLIKYKWLAAKRTFTNDTKTLTYYIAPDEPGMYSISVIVYDNYENSSTAMKALELVNNNIIKGKFFDENTNETIKNEDEIIQYIGESYFLNNMKSLLDEYKILVDKIVIYYNENYVFGQIQTIRFEEEILLNYKELANKLRSFNCPSSYINDKNNLVEITESICFYQGQIIKSHMVNDFDLYEYNLNKIINKIDELLNYYFNMVDKYNKKYH